jgi:predicted HTH domain antitoxin
MFSSKESNNLMIDYYHTDIKKLNPIEIVGLYFLGHVTLNKLAELLGTSASDTRKLVNRVCDDIEVTANVDRSVPDIDNL